MGGGRGDGGDGGGVAGIGVRGCGCRHRPHTDQSRSPIHCQPCKY
jgi:hypothetical protein